MLLKSSAATTGTEIFLIASAASLLESSCAPLNNRRVVDCSNPLTASSNYVNYHNVYMCVSIKPVVVMVVLLLLLFVVLLLTHSN